MDLFDHRVAMSRIRVVVRAAPYHERDAEWTARRNLFRAETDGRQRVSCRHETSKTDNSWLRGALTLSSTIPKQGAASFAALSPELFRLRYGVGARESCPHREYDSS